MHPCQRSFPYLGHACKSFSQSTSPCTEETDSYHTTEIVVTEMSDKTCDDANTGVGADMWLSRKKRTVDAMI